MTNSPSPETLENLEALERLAASVRESFGEPPEPLGERAADRLAGIVGSWIFLLVMSLFVSGYMLLQYILGERAFDPFPFVLLNLVLSCQASLMAPIILMSQNRAAAKDRKYAKKAYRDVSHIKELVELIRLMEEEDHREDPPLS